MPNNEAPSARTIALSADDVVDAALAILATEGFDRVSMRRVAEALGVSPFPLYSRIGNKDALLDAMAARVAAGFVVTPLDDEPWPDYARRWCHVLRERRLAVADSRLLLRGGREAMLTAAAPLIEVLRDHGVGGRRATNAARLLLWAVLGHVSIELSPAHGGHGEVDVDQLFADHVDYLVTGLVRDLGG